MKILIISIVCLLLVSCQNPWEYKVDNLNASGGILDEAEREVENDNSLSKIEKEDRVNEIELNRPSVVFHE